MGKKSIVVPVTEGVLYPVPQHVFWKAVMCEVNVRLGKTYTHHHYMSNVYAGTQYNKEVDTVLDDCITTVNADLKSRGLRAARPVLPRNAA